MRIRMTAAASSARDHSRRWWDATCETIPGRIVPVDSIEPGVGATGIAHPHSKGVEHIVQASVVGREPARGADVR